MSIQPFCRTLMFLLLLFMPAVFPLSLLPFIDPEALDGLRTAKKMSEFTKHLGIPDESLCYPDKDEKTDPMFHEELPAGDMIIDEEEMGDTNDEKEDDTDDIENNFADGISPEGKPKKTAKRPKTWPNGIIPYYISKDFNKKQKKKIENAIKDMNSKLTSVYFRPVEKSDKNYVVIFSGKGCYAKLGMKGGPQPVSLQTDKCLSSRGTIQHELLHILGFRHEQNRPDRNNYIEVIYNNIPEKWLKDYKRYKSSQANFVGKYDYYSVLHYPLQAPNSEGGKYAIRILDEDVDKEKVGEQKGITDKDIEKVEELYGNDS